MTEIDSWTPWARERYEEMLLAAYGDWERVPDAYKELKGPCEHSFNGGLGVMKEALQSKCARLEEALRKIANSTPTGDHVTDIQIIEAVKMVANEALSGGGGGA